MNSRDYWRKRELEHIEAMKAAQKGYGAEFARINERAIRNIEKEIEAFYGRYAEKEGISISVAKKKVSSMDVQAFSNKAAEYVKNENFSDEANEALRLYNLTMKVNRLELLKSACALELVNMGDEYQKYMGKVLTAEAEAEAKRQAGILGKTLDTTDIENAKKIVTGSWKNATFSERIWGNNASLKNNLDNLLTSGIIAGKHPTALARDLRKQFDVTRYEAERLMRTESSRIQGEIAISNYEADGVTEYEWIAEPSACDICAPLDGKRFKVKGAEVGNPDHPLFPMHPNCRCAIVPSLDREEYDAWLNQKGVVIQPERDYNRFNKFDVIKSNKILESMVNALDRLNVTYNPIREHDKSLSTSEIIKKLSGGDRTNGSCASLGLAYAGQRGGFDVVDFRGGESCNFFSSALNIRNIMRFDGINTISETARSAVTAGKRLLKRVEVGKEYYFVCGRHAAIVKRTENNALQYLELQSEESSGWMNFDGNPGYTLTYRFGATQKGRDYSASMCDVQELSESDDLKVLLGYINTDVKNQMKGVGGHEK